MSKKPTKEEEVEFRAIRKGAFGKCPCGEPTHSLAEFVGRTISIISYAPGQTNNPSVIIKFALPGGEEHVAYTFSKVISGQLADLDETLKQGKRVRALVQKIRNYLTLA